MNAYHQKFASKGLVVLAVSNEGKKPLESFKEKFAVQYALIHSVDGQNAYGVTGYPTKYLIGADGRVLATGHVSEDRIVEALKKVVMFPDVPATPKFKAVRAAVDKHAMSDLGKALAALEQDSGLSAEDKDALGKVRTSFNAMIEQTKAEIKELGAGPDFLAATERLVELSKSYRGLPIEADVKAQLDKFKSDAKVTKEIAAMKRLISLKKRYKVTRRSDVKKLLVGLKALSKRDAGTLAAKKADEMVTKLEAKAAAR